MVSINYSPVQELIVHDIIEVPTEDLLRERITPAGNMPLYWCAGVLFAFSSLPMTDDIVKDYLRGRVHWLEVHFTHLPKYEPIMVLNDASYSSAINIRIIDTSKSALHSEFISWLSNVSQPKKKRKE